MSTRHIYIDETKERGYVPGCQRLIPWLPTSTCACVKNCVAWLRTAAHPKKGEKAQRRKAIIDTADCFTESTPPSMTLAGYGDDHAARAACLRAIVDDIEPGQPTLLVLEQDDTLVRWDRRYRRAGARIRASRYRAIPASAREIRAAVDDPRCDRMVLGAWRRMARARKSGDDR